MLAFFSTLCHSMSYGRLSLCTLLLLSAVFVAAEAASPGASTPDDPSIASFGLPGALGRALVSTPRGNGIGYIDPQARQGFAGIPGAPAIHYPLAFIWAIWVGWIFSTVGAFGGIMAGVGHVTMLGLGAYAASFKETNPVLNALLTDTIRASNQYLVALSALISVLNFLRMRRIILPLGLALGIGSIIGSLTIPLLTAGKINLHQYLGYFGLVVLVIGGFLFSSTIAKERAGKQQSQTAAEAFQAAIKMRQQTEHRGVRMQQMSLFTMTFTFYGTSFSFNPVLPILGGIAIAALSSFLGIGGGFLYVPFMTTVVGLPMFVVAGTSALAVLVSMLMSIFSYVVVQGTFISWSLVGVELLGVGIGAMIGPRTQQYIPDIWLRRLFVLLALYVGLRYCSQGFFGHSWLPPF